MLSRADLDEAAAYVHRFMPPTAQFAWPLLSKRTGAETWVKHENHSPLGAFKVRGGLLYLRELRERHPDVRGVVAATRGNHGQSVAFAATRHGLRAVVCVPHGNSAEKNASMRALGAELIETGDDFQEAYEKSAEIAVERDLLPMPSFDWILVRGVASYALELFGTCADLDRVYVPIGLGSGICGVIAARDALGLKTEIYGVVAENAACYALSYEKGEPVSTNSANTIADGMACRVPVPEAVAYINQRAAGITTVSEEEIKAAMRAYFQDTHNLAEGAGAAPLAAALKDRPGVSGKKIGLILSGGNIDLPLYRSVLAEP